MHHIWLCIAIYLSTLAIMMWLGLVSTSRRRAEYDDFRAKPLRGLPSSGDTSADADDRVPTFPELVDSPPQQS
jgi:hypothetical protein